MLFQLISNRIHVKKIQAYTCTEKQKGNSKLREIASNWPYLIHTGSLV